MKCKICGVEVEKRGHNQKYCRECAKVRQQELMKQWQENHKVVNARCRVCGELLESARYQLCDKCFAHLARTRHREAQRRRAKK